MFGSGGKSKVGVKSGSPKKGAKADGETPNNKPMVKGRFQVHLWRASGLRRADFMGKSDPYAIV